PKPYFTEDGKIRFICGAQRENLTGTAIIFEMDNLEDTPRLLGELSLPTFDNKNVFMWECPDLLKLGDKDVFIWSPQGKEREAYQFQNNYHATYAVGKLTDLTFKAEYIDELDQGFDFYAPQTFAGLDNQAYAVLFGWIGLPDLTYPTDKFKWHSTLTLPRELRLEGTKIYQRPIAKIYENLTALSVLHLDEKADIASLDRAYIKFEANNQAFDLTFFQNEKGQSLCLSYENGLVYLDRSQTEQTELMEKFDTKRFCEIENLQTVEIFFDRSIIEIFFNHGEKAMTSRFFIENRKNTITINRPLDLMIGYLPAIQYI
ncbi:MAG: GH32 C-terminal domain-containing protein, partial [Haemophilus parainfluenzae]|nr:GH32 C-terminal domain-containing protein [Haemophilus parainfluenzae]